MQGHLLVNMVSFYKVKNQITGFLKQIAFETVWT